MQSKSVRENKFVLQILPWILGAAALTVYALTLNPWLSSFNMGVVSRLCGWEWHPLLGGPAYYAVTYPLHWLPLKDLPLALNIFSAVCGALAVGQLARSVALLPHDRTHDQRLREHSPNSLLSLPLAWVPPVLAAAACGLQLTFWANGTGGSAEMFDLLLFSFVVRSLLEYRIDRRESRLTRVAFVYGISMTNNAAMIGFFPLFVGALIWIRGVTFFNFRVLARMIVWGLVGLSLYLLLPYMAGRSEFDPIDFWTALKTNLMAQKEFLMGFSKKTTVLLAISSVLPVFLLSIRWTSQFGDNSQMGTALATFTYHLIHAMFLFACIWTAFDSPFSPRQLGIGRAFLPFYYLGALSVGYFSGYLLLVFKRVPTERPSGFQLGTHVVANSLVLTLVALVPAGLIVKNLPEIRIENSPVLQQFSSALSAGLPRTGVLLSDDPFRLMFLRSWLLRSNREADFIPLDTHMLVWPGYHRFLEKRYPKQWMETVDAGRTNQFVWAELLRQTIRLARSNDIYYLHPSYGYYFETFYLEPHGMVYKFRSYGTNLMIPPPLTPEIVMENESFWAKVATDTLPTVLELADSARPESKTNKINQIWRMLDTAKEPHYIIKGITSFYSRSLNYWGTEMQRLNELEKAGDHFQKALDLKEDNVVAAVNLACNKKLRAGIEPGPTADKEFEEMFGKYRSWDEILTVNGPYDDPVFCYAEGYRLMRYRNYHQAARAFDRVQAMSRHNVPSRLLLAQIYLASKLPDQTLVYVEELRNYPDRFSLNSTNRINLDILEGSAYLLKKDDEKGTRILNQSADMVINAGQPEFLNTIATIFSGHGLYSNALEVLDRRLAFTPDEFNCLIDKSYVYCQMKLYDKAIPVLTTALNSNGTNALALLNRAVAYLGNNQYAESKADYEKLQQLYPDARQSYFGLATIALHDKDTNAAIQHFEAFLTNAPPDIVETRFVKARLKSLKGEPPPAPAVKH